MPGTGMYIESKKGIWCDTCPQRACPLNKRTLGVGWWEMHTSHTSGMWGQQRTAGAKLEWSVVGHLSRPASPGCGPTASLAACVQLPLSPECHQAALLSIYPRLLSVACVREVLRSSAKPWVMVFIPQWVLSAKLSPSSLMLWWAFWP